MPKIIKYCTNLLVVIVLCLAAAEVYGQELPSLKEHSDVLVAIIFGLVTVINSWVTYSQITLRKLVNATHDMLVQIVTSHNIHHTDERIEIKR